MLHFCWQTAFTSNYVLSNQTPAVPWHLLLATQIVSPVCYRLKFISKDFRVFFGWYISENTANVKANESVRRLKRNRLQWLKEAIRILNGWFPFHSKTTCDLKGEASQRITRRTNTTYYKPLTNITFVNLGKIRSEQDFAFVTEFLYEECRLLGCDAVWIF
jgi:hypothetical protein